MTKNKQKTLLILLGFILGILVSYVSYLNVHQNTNPSNKLSNHQALTKSKPATEITLKKNDTEKNSISSLLANNKKLKQTITQLQNTIKQLQQNKNSTVNSSSLTVDDKSNKRNSKLKFLSPDFIKKNIPKKEYIISPQLKKVLDLSPEQSEKLSELLVMKAAEDIDVMTPILEELSTGSVEQLFDYGETGEISNPVLEQQINEQLDNKQYYFEQNLREFLSEDQLTNYYNFEINNATKQYQNIMKNKSQALMRLPKIETYQKDDIKQYFSEIQPDVSKIKIASSRNPISRGAITIPKNFDAKLKAHLKELLTDEQFKAFEDGLGINY